MPLHDNEVRLRNYRQEDQERAAEQYARAARRLARDAPLREVIGALYGMEDNRPELAQLFGSPALGLSTGARTAAVIQPQPDPNDVVPGLEFGEVVELIGQGRLIPLIKDPLYYVKYDHLAELITKFRPPSYFSRSDLLYSLLAGGTDALRPVRGALFSGEAGDWYDEAFDLTPVARSGEETYRKYWEPEQAARLPRPVDENGRGEIIQSFAFKVVNAKALLGSKFVDTVIRDLPTDKTLRFLTALHMLTDHPMSHALLSTAVVDFTHPHFDAFAHIANEYVSEERLQVDVVSVPLSLFARPTFRAICAAMTSGVCPLPQGIPVELGNATRGDLTDLQARCTRAAAEYDDWVRRYEGKTSRVERVLKVCLYGATAVAGAVQAVTVQEIASMLLGGIGAVGVAKTLAEIRGNLRLQHLIASVFDAQSTEQATETPSR